MADTQLTIRDDELVLAGVLDFETVVALDADGSRWLRETAPAACRLDLSGVTHSTSAGVALVLGWLRTAGKAGKRLQITHVPADMAALIRVTGLQALLDGA